MTSTSVGMRCPECASQKTRVVNPIGAAGRNDAPATYAIIAVCVIAYVADIAGGGGIGSAGGGTLTEEGGLFAYGLNSSGEAIGVAFGQPYRLVTAAFLHAGFIHLAFNMFALYILGTLLEPAIGTPRFVALYFASLLAGSLGVILLEPDTTAVGASGAIFGLFGATAVLLRRLRYDMRPVIALLVINLIFTFGWSNIAWQAHIGGLVAGVITGYAMVHAPREHRNLVQYGTCAVVLVAVVVMTLLRTAQLT